MLRSDIVVAYTDTDGYGQRADRRPPGRRAVLPRDRREDPRGHRPAAQRDRGADRRLQLPVLLPVLRFPGPDVALRQPARAVRRAGRRDRGLGHADRRRPVHRRPRRAALAAAHGVPDAPRRPTTPTRCDWPQTSTRTSPTCAATRSRSTTALFDDPRFDVSDHRAVRAGHPRSRSDRWRRAPDWSITSAPWTATRGNHRTARLVAIVAGPARRRCWRSPPRCCRSTQTTAQLNWPQNGVLASVDAPLIGYVATDLKISDPVQRRRRPGPGPERGKTVLLSTVPKQAPKAVDRGLLIERVNDDLLVIVRNTPVVSAPLSQVLSPACQQLTFTAHADKVTGEFVGLVKGPDSRRRPANRCAASAAATTSARRSSACSPTCPGPRRRACSSRRPSTPATAPRRRCSRCSR